MAGNNRTGPFGEAYAAEFLEKDGYRILERNYHSRFGEVDIIAEKGRYLVFVEVKTRESRSMVPPEAAVTPGKQKRIAKTALLYLQKHPTHLQPRFDVIGIIMEKTGRSVQSCRHIENAFGFSSYF